MSRIALVDSIVSQFGVDKTDGKAAAPTSTLALENVAVYVALLDYHPILCLIFRIVPFKTSCNGKAMLRGMIQELLVVHKGAIENVTRLARPNRFRLLDARLK